MSGFTGSVAYYGRRPELAPAIRAKMLPCGALAVVEDDLAGSGGEAYIDSVGPTAALLAEETPSLAARHVYWTLNALQQADGSMLQIASFDAITGAVRSTRTGRQGYSLTSRWARSQAWGLLALAMSAPFTQGSEVELGESGRRLADWWMDQTDPRSLPPWDFGATDHGPDSSAGAIAAAALIGLAAFESNYGRRRLMRRHAEQLTRTLLDACDPSGALLHGCYDRSLGLATDSELIWGDHYLLEALQSL